MITVYQIKVTSEQVREFNSGKTCPAIEAKHKLMLSGSKRFTPAMLLQFTATCEVDTDDLEHAFEITNLWHESHLVNRLTDKVSSTSVGDIFEKDGKFFMVDDCGFGELAI